MKTILPDIYLAVMEGLTFEMMYNIESLADFGINISSLKATGGGASSPVWLQLKADILGREITPLKNDEAGTVGCAMMAGAAVGAYSGLREAADVFVRVGETCYPNDKLKDFYADKYNKYKQIRNGTLNVWG
jgi:xylulokinase